jgi:acyl carrier protein phosphodiesterase
MNFLAHCHLSGENRDILFGNFIADSVKGSDFNKFPTDIRNGIIHHRKIDTYTDRHEIVRTSIKLIRPVYGKFSGIIIDIYYDHFLALNWEKFHDQPLSDYSRDVYFTLGRRFKYLPARNRRMLPFLIAQNWLSSYANIDDLRRVFWGMDRRTKNISGMKDAVDQLVKNHKLLESHFMEFYPELQEYAKVTLNEIISAEQEKG